MEFQIKITEASRQMLANLHKKFRAEFIKGLKQAMLYAESKARKGFNKTERPKVKTGQLRRTIKSGVKITSTDAIGFLSANTIYARIQELGGIIRPRTADYLRFQINGRWISTKQVIIPERPYLRPAIEENINKIEDIIKARILKI